MSTLTKCHLFGWTAVIVGLLALTTVILGIILIATQPLLSLLGVVLSLALLYLAQELSILSGKMLLLYAEEIFSSAKTQNG